jgi:lipoate synthase
MGLRCAWLYAVTVRAINGLNPSTGVQQLIPYFNGGPSRLPDVFESRPEVLARNVERLGHRGIAGPRITRRSYLARTLD